MNLSSAKLAEALLKLDRMRPLNRGATLDECEYENKASAYPCEGHLRIISMEGSPLYLIICEAHYNKYFLPRKWYEYFIL